MTATSGSTRRQLLAVFALLFVTLNNINIIIPSVHAHQDHSGQGIFNAQGPMLSNWFRRISSTSSDGNWLWGWAWGADNTVSVVDRSPPVSFASRPASFGRMIEDALIGYGIPMNSFTVKCHDDRNKSKNVFEYRHGDLLEGIGPNLGCPRLCPSGNHMPLPEESWIAIVQRGNCSFVSKVREAQQFGAKAAIVGGDDPAISGNPDVLVNMYSQTDASDIKIPSTYIKFSDYTHLANLIASSNTSTSGIKTVSLQITTDYASWEWYSPILTFLVLLLLPSALTLTTLLIHRVRAARAEQRERAPEDVVNRLPWRVWTGSGWEKHEGPVPPAMQTKSSVDTDLERGNLDAEIGGQLSQSQAQQLQCKPSTSHDEEEGDGGDTRSVNPPWFDAQTECAICLNDFMRGDRVRVLPCKHIFHLDEVDEWLIHRKKLCPVCKADVTLPSHPYVHPIDHDHSDTHATPIHVSSNDPTDELTTPNERTPLLVANPPDSLYTCSSPVTALTPSCEFSRAPSRIVLSSSPTPFRSRSPSPSPSTFPPPAATETDAVPSLPNQASNDSRS
ncbi:hypothetical protein ACEPAH_8625 [Sanghuangporus vaninii]